MNKTKDWNQPYSEVKDWEKLSDKMVELGYLPPKEHSEKIEFLSRQHIDFKTLGGMKEILQAVTWRIKVEEGINQATIYVRKKRIPDVRRLAKELGIAGFKYDVKEIGWFECWFKRFKVGGPMVMPQKEWPPAPERKQWCAFDLAKGSDYSAEAIFEKKADGSLEFVNMVTRNPVKLQKLISTGQCNAPGQKQIYFVDIPEGELEKEMIVLLNKKRFKIQRTINRKGNPKTGISGYFF